MLTENEEAQMRNIFGLAASVAISLLVATQNALAASACMDFFRATRVQIEGSSQTDAVLLGETPDFHFSGLEANQIYSVTLTSNFGSGMQTSSVEVKSTPAGEIHTATMNAIRGSYVGVHENGLFWALQPVAASNEKSDFPAYHFRLKVERNKQVLLSETFESKYLSPDVLAKDLPRESGLVGRWFLPKNPAQKVVVVTLTGSEGGIFSSSMMSAVLANHGIPSLALAHFAMPGLPQALDRIPLEYFARAFDYIRSAIPDRDTKIVVLGPSRGGELSLLLGALFPQVQGVVAISPSLYIWGANNSAGTRSSAWTLNGAEVPYMYSVGELERVRDSQGVESLANRPAFERALMAVPEQMRPRSLIERTNGPILLIAGMDDQIWPAADFVRTAEGILKSSHRPFKDETLIFPGVGHDFMPPTFPTTSRSIEHPQMGLRLALGGTPRAAGDANVIVWRKIIEFLKRI
jgi:pimeloyl-ACP methyl ester carboxylesterase